MTRLLGSCVQSWEAPSLPSPDEQLCLRLQEWDDSQGSRYHGYARWPFPLGSTAPAKRGELGSAFHHQWAEVMNPMRGVVLVAYPHVWT